MADDEQEVQPKSAAKRLAEEAKAQAVEYAKECAKEQAKAAVKRAAATAVKKTAQATVAVASKHPMVLGVLAAVVVLVLVFVGIFTSVRSCASGGASNKFDNESGGSWPVGLNYENELHRQFVANVVELASGDEPVLVSFASALDLPVALDWSEDEERDKFHKLDWRVIAALAYLGDVWQERGQGNLGVTLLGANGPRETWRERLADASDEDVNKSVGALSAYGTGQAIGIGSIGLTSPELTRAMGWDKPRPVQVGWQRTISEQSIRPLYEQIEVDAAELFKGISYLFSAAKARTNKVVPDNPTVTVPDIYNKVLEVLDKLIINLQKVPSIKGVDDRAAGFAGQAVDFLQENKTKLAILQDAEDLVGFIELWGDEKVEADFRDGIHYAFKAMQVANMVGWRGNSNRELWKAYEARQNIRQLALDLLRMPIELAQYNSVAAKRGFDSNLIVKQIIIYSPEDDLDNSLPDLDVFPDGIVAVSEGGVAFGPREGEETIGDGRHNIFDSYFAFLPIDNGIFSKACTVFVYKTKDSVLAEQYRALIQGLAPTGATAEMCQLLYGSVDLPQEDEEMTDGELEDEIPSGGDNEEEEIEVVGQVSYQKFVHIGF